MDLNIGGWIAIALTPALIAYAHSLALRRFGDGKHFRPVPAIRALYSSGIILLAWGVCFFVQQAMVRGETFQNSDWFGLALFLFFTGTTIWSWPGTFVIQENGLSLRRMFRLRQLYPWSSIDDVGPTIDESDGLIIYLKDGSQLAVSRFVEGWPQLQYAIRKHLHK